MQTMWVCAMIFGLLLECMVFCLVRILPLAGQRAVKHKTPGAFGEVQEGTVEE